MENISKLRKKIDKIDESVINLIAKRYDLVRKVGSYKKLYGLSVEDSDREKWLSEYHKSISIKFGLNPEVIHEMFSIIIEQAKRIQKNDQK